MPPKKLLNSVLLILVTEVFRVLFLEQALAGSPSTSRTARDTKFASEKLLWHPEFVVVKGHTQTSELHCMICQEDKGFIGKSCIFVPPITFQITEMTTSREFHKRGFVCKKGFRFKTIRSFLRLRKRSSRS